ncbi:MAG: 30S ribosome-binding factor RbfA [Spirochaetota bacterium]
MPKHRMDRINETLAHHLAKLIVEESVDPRLATIITITKVETTKDLRTATVSISVLDTSRVKDVLRALSHASGFFIERLKDLMPMRYIPSLRFVYDDSLVRMNSVLTRMKAIENERKEHGDEKDQ